MERTVHIAPVPKLGSTYNRNISGIKLRGASFLMHQVYDDEMTFKLVTAASKVSGLPVEVCLEEFGKHFLVYCQKNGYDQILRVLGSNLFDFLTNLDNLHDHLGSIYPGMRAPSFRVTRKLAGSSEQISQRASMDSKQAFKTICENSNGYSLDQSMYLHYYSERAGLSPIVKGLVMAVAREFFHTEINISDCGINLTGSNGTDQQANNETNTEGSHKSHDHVVLKIDRRPHEQLSQAQVEIADKQRPSDQEHLLDRTSMLNIYNSFSNNESSSLVNSEIMMQAFPFHVIFDRQFKLLQVGQSLLRVTSEFWRTQASLIEDESFGAQRSSHLEEQENDCEKSVKFTDLFRIVRPKIELTFDAIVDHLNQVFVVKTHSSVLNSDHPGPLEPVPELYQSSSCSSTRSSASGLPQASQRAQVNEPMSAPLCPFERLAQSRCSAGSVVKARRMTPVNLGDSGASATESIPPTDTTQEYSVPNRPSLRLKGQMIVLLDGQMCLFLCSPRVDDLKQLMECGIRMSDFAIHDRARELMLMSHTHKGDREAVKKLDQATNDLKKMDTKLRQENKRTNEVLHNIFPAKIATLLSHGHRVESESFEMVTCLYSDIIGFTRMCGSENVRPIDIVRLLNTLYLQFDSLTNIHGVFKVETIGDAYVVVGGLPEPAADHADRCVRMGLDMVRVIQTVRSPADRQPIQMRIGIHSGPVMAGIVGVRVPRYSLFGNTTTLANQLETHGSGGKIHISDFTLRNLIHRDKFIIEPNEPSNGGSIVHMDTHFVVGYKGDEMETQEHEKTLKEQLIKDFEQMSQDELDLLDQSYRILANKKEWQAAASLEPIIQEPEVITTKNGATKSNGQNTQTYPEDQMEMSALKDLTGQLSDSIILEALRQVHGSELVKETQNQIPIQAHSDSETQTERTMATPELGEFGCGNCLVKALLQLHQTQKKLQRDGQQHQELNLNLIFHLNPSHSNGQQSQCSPNEQDAPIDSFAGEVCIQVKLSNVSFVPSEPQASQDQGVELPSRLQALLESNEEPPKIHDSSQSHANRPEPQSSIVASQTKLKDQIGAPPVQDSSTIRQNIRPGITKRVKQIRRMDTFGRLKQNKQTHGFSSNKINNWINEIKEEEPTDGHRDELKVHTRTVSLCRDESPTESITKTENADEAGKKSSDVRIQRSSFLQNLFSSPRKIRSKILSKDQSNGSKKMENTKAGSCFCFSTSDSVQSFSSKRIES